MANNRMYLRCRKCGRTLYIGKTFLDGYYYYPTKEYMKGRTFQEILNDFYEEHTWCCQDRNLENECIGYSLEEYPLPPIESVNEENVFDIVYEDNKEIGEQK